MRAVLRGVLCFACPSPPPNNGLSSGVARTHPRAVRMPREVCEHAEPCGFCPALVQSSALKESPGQGSSPCALFVWLGSPSNKVRSEGEVPTAAINGQLLEWEQPRVVAV